MSNPPTVIIPVCRVPLPEKCNSYLAYLDSVGNNYNITVWKDSDCYDWLAERGSAKPIQDFKDGSISLSSTFSVPADIHMLFLLCFGIK